MELQNPFSLITCLLFLIFLFKFLKLCKRFKANNRNQKLPPGPWKLPLIGNLHHLVGCSLPHRALRELAKKHGPLMHLQLGEVSAIVVSSPKLAKEVMRTHDLAFANRPELVATKILFKGGRDIAFTPYCDFWRQMRKVCILELLSAKRVQSFSSLREDDVSNLIESIRFSASSSPINLTKKISSLTSNIVCRAAFGNKCKDQEAFIYSTRKALDLAGGFDLADLFPSLGFLQVITGVKAKLEKIHRETDKILDYIINEHRENTKSKTPGKGELKQEDLIDVLLRLLESGSLQFPITTSDIKAIIRDVFIAGTDTSSMTIEWAMAEMMRNPRVMEKAQAEVRQALKGKTNINEADIQELCYLKLVIKETLRLHPPGPLLIPRECREQCEIDGYKIPIKTKVIVNAWAIGRDPEYWDDAESFVPERFSDSSIDFKGNNFEYIPFGAGRRICPGISFGLANIELPLAQLLYHFNWKIPGGIKPGDLDTTETFGLGIGRKNKLYLIATPYDPSIVD